MNIGIIGCGWLGFPLAKSLVNEGYFISGTTTSKEKIKKLQEAGIHPFFISISETGIEGDIESFVKSIDTLIINIPPRLRGNNNENYVSKINHLIQQIEKSKIDKVLFIGSTSVYDNTNTVVTEETLPNPETNSGKQLLEVEKSLTSNKFFKTTILRFGGLFGENRNPANFLSGRKNVTNPYAPVNLIHLKDCIGIIKVIIKNNIWNDTFNAASPHHPSKKDYYTKKALDFGIEPPTFNFENPSKGKTIDPGKLIKVLDYNFIVSL